MATKRIKDLSGTATSPAVDDYLALDGTTNGTRKITRDNLISSFGATYLEESNNLSDVDSVVTSRANLDVMATGDVNDRSNSRAPSNGMLLGDEGYLRLPSFPAESTDDNFTTCFKVRFTSTPSSQVVACMLTFSGTGSSSTNGGLTLQSDNTLDVDHYDGSFDSINDILGGAVDVNRTYHIAYRVNSGDDGLAVFVDGVKKGTVATGPGTSTGRVWQIGVSNQDNSGTEFLGFVHYNRVLTDAEIAEEAVRQVPEVVDQWGGAATYTSDFSSGVDGWTSINGSGFDGDIDGVGGQDDNLWFRVDTSTGEKGVQLSEGWPAGNKRYRLTFDIYVPSGNAALDGYRIKHSVDGELKSQTLTANTWTSVTLDHLSTAQGNLKIISQAAGAQGYTGNGSDVFYLRNIKVTSVGAVVALLPNNVLESGDWQDASTNRLNAVGTGTTALIPNRATYERSAVDDLALARTPSNAVWYNGVDAYNDCTDNALFEFGDGTTDNPFSIRVVFMLPTLGVNEVLVAKSNSSGTAREYHLKVASGIPQFTLFDNSSTDYIQTVAGSALSANRWYELIATYDGSSNQSGLNLYLNGVAIAQTQSLTGSYTAMHATSQSLKIAREGSGYGEAYISRAEVYNRELSATDAANLHGNEVEVADRWGGAVTYTSDFSAGADSFAATANISVAGNIDSIGGQNNNLRLTCDATTGNHYSVRSSTVTVGQKYRITYDAYLASTNSNVDGWKITDSGTTIDSETSPATDTWVRYSAEWVQKNSHSLTFQLLDGGATSFADAGADDVLYFRNIVITPIGAVVALLPTPGSIESDGTWLDSSSNTLNATPTGVTPLYTEPQVSGTFTPTLTFGDASVGMTYATNGQEGYWRKLDEKTVVVEILIRLSSKGTSTTYARIEGLPFTVRSPVSNYNTAVGGVGSGSMQSLTGALSASLRQNTTSINLMQSSATGDSSITHANFTNSSTISVSAVYTIE